MSGHEKHPKKNSFNNRGFQPVFFLMSHQRLVCHLSESHLHDRNINQKPTYYCRRLRGGLGNISIILFTQASSNTVISVT